MKPSQPLVHIIVIISRCSSRGDFSYGKNGWVGQRVELNAMTSAQFVNWLENKLRKAKVTKVVPDNEALTKAWKRALKIAKVREIIQQKDDQIAAPKNLEKKVRAMLKRNENLSWDKALAGLAREEIS
jgi:hypothetical protein